MIPIVSVSDMRANLSKILKKVNETKEPVIVVQDSSPSVVVYPYEDFEKLEQEKKQLSDKEFNEMLVEGKKAFKKYLKKNNIPYPKTEEEAYEIIKNA